jgi:hypothetical protein
MFEPAAQLAAFAAPFLERRAPHAYVDSTRIDSLALNDAGDRMR